MGQAPEADADVLLMLEVQAGRPGAFEELVRRTASDLSAFVARQMGSREVVEDVVQEIYLKVYRARERYRPTARFRTWLLTIATNLCLNWRRYQGHRFHLSLDAAAAPGEEALAPSVPDPSEDRPESGLDRDEMAQRVRAAIDSLPDTQRVAVILLRYENLGYREIADVMDLSVQAVKSLLNRAKESLRERLSRDVKDWLAAGPDAPRGRDERRVHDSR